MRYRSIDSADLQGRKVFLRADLNVPLEDGRIADDTRIRRVIPTIEFLLENGASVIIASHLGRPGGTWTPLLSLAPVAERLEELLVRKVLFAPDCVGARVSALVAGLDPGDILLLENLRFHPEEKEGDREFARQLSSFADIYVNDAFGTSHREHASMMALPEIMGGGYAGLLLKRELEVFQDMLSNPARPFVLLLGGAKVSDKVPVIENLLPRLDHILIGGGMAFTFMKTLGMEVGTSLLEHDRLGAASKILNDAKNTGVKVQLPVDIVVAPSPGRPELATTVPADEIPFDKAGLDIGAKTIQQFGNVIANSRTVVWNGPMGVFEIPPFDTGTRELAQIIAQATQDGTVSVVGGGDSVRAITEAGLAERVSFISTGGGASLKLLQGAELKALEALGRSDS